MKFNILLDDYNVKFHSTTIFITKFCLLLLIYVKIHIYCSHLVTVLGYLLLILVFISGCISSIFLLLGIRSQNVSYVAQWLIVFVIVIGVEVLKELVDVCLAEDGLIITLLYIVTLLGEFIIGFQKEKFKG